MDEEQPPPPPPRPSAPPRESRPDLATSAGRRVAAIYRAITTTSPQLELQLLGRVLLHAALVGMIAGLLGSAFVWAAEGLQDLLLVDLAGYTPLCAAGEHCREADGVTFRWWLLLFLPATGGLLAGILAARFGPEVMGGGTDAILEAFHHHDGVVRRRVLWLRPIASVLTLGFGGSGGREGPTMQLGGAIGSFVGRTLKVSARERRVLMVAGIAAGVSAVFRTPLGAALLAVEVLHRDDFESDALVPAVLASVVAYSVIIFFFGEAVLFAHAPRYPFTIWHLPLYVLMAVLVVFAGAAFVGTLHAARGKFDALAVPLWAKPAIGGLILSAIAVPTLLIIDHLSGTVGRGLGILGGGYGAAQIAISGHDEIAGGWSAVGLLLVLAVLKTFATAATIGSGGSAGAFGPSLMVGGLVGGAFGRAAQLLVDPSIDPGAFALVGMGTLYGGVGHVPLAALVLVCELAGSYDLLVPLMLAGGVAYVANRRVSLYRTQKQSRRDSPAHREDMVVDVLRAVTVGDILVRDRPFVSFITKTPGVDVLAHVADNEWQDVFPVLSGDRRSKDRLSGERLSGERLSAELLEGAGVKLVGIITSDVLRTVAADPELAQVALAADMMVEPVSVNEACDLHRALELMLQHRVRELVVTDASGHIVGLVDEHDIGNVYHETTRGALQRNTIPAHVMAPLNLPPRDPE